MKFNTSCWILGFILIGIVFIGGCAQKEKLQINEADESNAEIQEPVQQVEGETTPPSQGLGMLCSGEEECIAFC